MSSEVFPSTTPSPPPDDMFDEGVDFNDPPPPHEQAPVAHPNDPPEHPAYSTAPSVSNPNDGVPAAAQVAPTRQVAPPRRTDHTYHDYATQTPSPYEYPVTKKSTSNFPAKLHRMISEPANAQAIQWQPHGRAWKVLDKELLLEVVIPKYFVQTNFLRGLPHLTRMMKRAEPNQGKLLPHVEAEPNFYEMDMRHRLPPSPAYPPPPAVGAAHYPYGYPGHGPPPPPANYPPYDPYGYPYPQHPQQPGQPHPMYPPPQRQDPYAYPGAAAALPQPHPAYGQAQPGYPDPHAFNMYPPPPNPNHHYPDPYPNHQQNDNHESHPGY
ncbi:hypothetical protein ACHAXN_001057 [Cyclotella atomus]